MSSLDCCSVWEGLDHCGWCTPGQIIRGAIRKQTEQHSSAASVSAPASVPALASLNDPVLPRCVR